MSDLVSAYYTHLAVAFVRGHTRMVDGPELSVDQQPPPLEDLTPAQCEQIIAAGLAAELPLYPFKRTRSLARVQWALGVLRGIQPASLLDVGSGRGTVLWPLLDALPHLPVTAVEVDARRAQHLRAVQMGGVDRLSVHQADATDLPFADHTFDVVTLLEVLEHIPDAQAALAEAVRVGRRFLLLSAPSRPDDNPEHLHLFAPETLRRMLAACGVERVKWNGVPGHRTLFASLE